MNPFRWKWPERRKPTTREVYAHYCAWYEWLLHREAPSFERWVTARSASGLDNQFNYGTAI